MKNQSVHSLETAERAAQKYRSFYIDHSPSVRSRSLNAKRPIFDSPDRTKVMDRLEIARARSGSENIYLEAGFWGATILLLAAACFFLAGCGAGGYAGGGVVGLSSSTVTIDAGQSFAITANLSGTANVSWNLSGPGCSGSTCGSVTGSGASVTYTAPANLTSQIKVTLTAGVAGTSNSQAVAFTVNPDPTITSNLPSGTVGTPYTGSITTAGGTVPLKFSMTGEMPAGLSYNATTGVVSGTPTVAGTSTFTAQTVDSSDIPFTVKVIETIVIGAPNTGSNLAISGAPAAGTVGTPYSSNLLATGGTGPYTFSVLSGALPAGLSLSAATGAISGTPTTQGNATFVAQVQDSTGAVASGTFTIPINAATAPLTLTVTSLPNGTVGTPYSATIGVSGGTGPYTCTITAGTLPAGLSLGAGCVVSGTPTTAGTSNLTVKVTDSANPAQTVSGPVSITIAPAALVLTNSTLPNGTVGTPYTATIGVAGGTGPYSCTVTGGTLPAGLTMGAGCLVSGTPTVAGTSPLTVRVTDSSNPALTVSGPESITIAPAALTLTSTTLPNGTVGTPYSATIGVTGGTGPYSCAVTGGTLPAGLTMGAGCVVSGTPTVAGTSPLTVKVTDSSNPALTVSGPESITIAPAALVLTASTLPDGTVGTPYTATVGVTGGTSPYSCTVTAGTLPAGLAFGAGCVLSGTPTAAGTTTVTVKVTDSSTSTETISGPETITIAPAPIVLVLSSPPGATVGTPYTGTIGVTGGTGPYSCSITAGSLPAGLTLGANCTITGTPTTPGNPTVTVKVTDSSNPVATTTGPVTLVVSAAPLTLTTTSLPNGTVGTPYSATIGVSGGTSPYSCSIVSGTLPAGLTLGAACAVTGTPILAGTSTLTIKATDSSNPAVSTTGPVSITIAPAVLVVTTTLLPNGTVGTPYSATIGVTGGTGPYTCTVTLGTLPAGLTMGAGCVVSGTPTVAGISPFTVHVVDSGNPALTANGLESITIAPAALVVTTTLLPNGTVGTPYSATIGVTGGTGPYTCTVTVGTLPAGLTMGAGCVVSGTPTVAGISPFTVQVTDSGNPALTATGLESITIAPAALVVTTTLLPNGTVGTPYSATIGVTGGTGPYTCTVTVGTLPAGLTMGAGCVVSGTPTVAGISPFTVHVVDSGNPALTANGLESITIAPAALVVTTTLLPNGTVGTPYSATIGVTGGTGPYTCTVTVGTLPAGLTMGAGCVVSGTPTVAGISPFTVHVVDSGNPALTANGLESITIAPAALVVTTTLLPNGTVGTPYSATIGVTGGTGPYTCTVTLGTLPAGLTMGAGCVVSGTPTVAGISPFTVHVVDSGNPALTATGLESITIAPAALVVTTTLLPNGTVGTPYSATIGVTGGTGPYTCTVTLGTLPAGLTMGTGCVVSGTPTVAGISPFTVQVTDSGNPALTATGLESITIAPAALVVTTTLLPNGTVGTPYSATIGVTGGTGPYTCTVTLGTLPAGLTMGAGCVVSGTPTVAGISPFTVHVVDSGNPALTANGLESITIAPAALVLTTSSLPNGMVGTPYSATIGVSGGTSPYNCTIVSGTLPAGLSLGAACAVTGTPTVAGTFTLSVKATDSGIPAQTTTGPVTITITPATLALTTSSLPNGMVGTPYSATIGVTGGTAPYSCTITSGTLPAGLTLGAGCVVSGTPTVAGTSPLTVRVTDSANPAQTVNGPESITIAPETLVLTTSTLPNGTVGTPYSATIGVTGGTSPYSCTVTSGTLPAGLTMGAGCVVAGVPTVAGTSHVVVLATDSANPAQTVSGPETIIIAAAPPTLTLSSPAAATVLLPYTGTIGVSGGTGPYSCNIVSGTLPLGLLLGPNCTITGIPLLVGSSILTVTATDSSHPAGTITGPITVTVSPVLATLTLSPPPDATVGTPYTGTIGVTGGTAPYNCTFVSGALPAGLALGPNCTITGTPTTAGSATVTITATDSGTPQASITGPVTITVRPVTPLTLTGSVPNATLGLPYTQTLQAAGGIAPYTYAITAGALPAGLTLSPAGVISGTPTAVGASSFTVTATDSENPVATASLPLVILVAYPPTPYDPQFAGPYAYLFQGYDDAVLGVLAYKTATVGSFTADGTGIISAGEMDANHQTSVAAGSTVSSDAFLGTYTIGSDNRGSITITTIRTDGTTGRTHTYAIALLPPVSPSTISVRADMIESDSDQLSGSKGAGTILAQTTSAFGTGLQGNYAFGLSGDTPCLLTCGASLLFGGPVAAVGEFTANDAGAISSGSGDLNIAASNYANNTLSGTYGPVDGNGRLALTMATSGAPAGYPTDYAVYMVSADYAFVMSTDKHSTFALVAGTAQSQTQATFNNASMSGPFVGYENSPTNPGLVGQTLDKTLSLSTATVFQATANAAGKCTTNQVDIGGLTGVVNALTGLGSGSNLLNAVLGTYSSTGQSNCTVASNGRGVLAYPTPDGALTLVLQLLGLAPNPPAPRVFYLISPTQGYFLETGYAGLGEFDPQTGGPFTLGTLNGTYVYGSVPSGSVASIATDGIITADGHGNGVSTADTSVGVGTLNVITLGTSGSFTYTLQNQSEGRYIDGTSVIYAISPGKFVLLDENILSTAPSVNVLY